MRKLIFLIGESNCGKTTTLKMLIAMLMDLKKTHTFSINYPKKSSRLSMLWTAWQRNSKMPDGDFSVVLNVDGVIVGIKTMGDTIGSVWDAVAFFENHSCDVGVLACHEDHLQRSGSCLTSGWQNEKIKKKKTINSSLIDQENENMAKILFDKVMDVVA